MKICEICGKKPKIKIKRSHSMQAIKTTQYPNVQKKKINNKRINICTQCLSKMTKKAS